MNKQTIAEVMREMGRKGGKIGGKRSLETMTPEARTARAKKASQKAAEVRTEKAALAAKKAPYAAAKTRAAKRALEKPSPRHNARSSGIDGILPLA